MRTARVKPLAATPDGTYYHLVNRVSGSPTDYPFGDIEKEKFIAEDVKPFVHELTRIITN